MRDRSRILSCMGLMKHYIYIPPSKVVAERLVQSALGSAVRRIPKRNFLKAYCSLAYLYPGFHPDFIEEWEGPKDLMRIAREARRREKAGELTDNELYPYQASK